MLAEVIEEVKVEREFRETWNTLSPIQKKCCALAMLAIEEAAPILLEEGGVPELLKGLAVLMNGTVLPAPIIRHLEDHAARLMAA